MGSTPWETVAVNVFRPSVGPSVQEPTVAKPAESDTASVPVALPPPDVTAKVTVTPFAGFPESNTRTDGLTATGRPTVAYWLSPVCSWSAAADWTLAGFVTLVASLQPRMTRPAVITANGQVARRSMERSIPAGSATVGMRGKSYAG
jgi:hypothetical protein